MRALPQVVPTQPGRPQVGGPDHPMRLVTRAVAFEPDTWTPAKAAQVAAMFDGLAPEWGDRMHADEAALPLADVLARGGPLGERWVEVGAGTGKATEVVAPAARLVVAVDVAGEMLRRLDPALAARVRADGAALPVRDGAADVVLAVDAFLFPDEVDRVLAPGGALVWVNTLAEWTPIHLPPEDVVAALPGAWDGVWAPAGWGTWTVVRRIGR